MAEKTYCEVCNRSFPNEDALSMHNAAKHQVTSNPKKNSKKIKSILTITIIVLLLLGGWSVFFKNKPVNENPLNNLGNNKEVQKINLGFDKNYYPNTIKVKANQPVEITLDNSVGGCFRSFNIKELGVNYYSKNPSDTIKFTPNKKGTFEFACGMRMGRGKIVVE